MRWWWNGGCSRCSKKITNTLFHYVYLFYDDRILLALRHKCFMAEKCVVYQPHTAFVIFYINLFCYSNLNNAFIKDLLNQYCYTIHTKLWLCTDNIYL